MLYWEEIAINHSLTRQIEIYRKDMMALSEKYGVSSNVVIRASWRLDALLNEYQEFEMEKENKQQNYLGDKA